MHPILASGRRLGLYLASWLQIGVLLAAAYSTASAAGWLEAFVVILPLCLVYAFVCLSAWYVCRAAPLAATPFLRTFVSHAGAAGISAGFWLLLWEVWTRVVAGYPAFSEAVAHYHAQIGAIFAAAVLLFWLAGMFHYLVIAFETSRQAETRELGLEILAREAELKALRSQIDPHFLFNSLHSISALTSTDPAGARRMCLLLADFFRSSVRLGPKDFIRLEDEIDMVRQYLEIEKVRFGQRLSAEIDVDPQCKSCAVPPLILQPLVENSVRHGINSLVGGGVVRITGRCSSGMLSLRVENPIDVEPAKTAGAGVGLENVKLRLRKLFGSSSETRIAREDQRFRVEIRFPCSGPLST